MTIGWDKSKVDGAMYDISRLYIRFYEDNPIPIREFLEKHHDFAVYVWLVCQHIRPEFPLDVKIELRAFKNYLQIGITNTPEFHEGAVKKSIRATEKAKSDAFALDKTWDIDQDLLVIDIF